jgi:PAS domain S-box-containing protein
LPAALDALPTFIYVKDRERRIVSANLSFCRALGVDRKDLIGKLTDPFLGEEGPLSARVDRDVIETGTPRLGIVEKHIGPDGVHWVLTDKTPIKDDVGNIVGLVGTTVDITARKQAEDALSQSEARLRFLTDNMADMLWVMDLNLRTTYISPSVERLLGFTAEEWMAKRVEEMATAGSVSRIYSEMQRQLALEASGTADPNRTLTLEVEFYHKNGSTLLIEQVIRALRDDAGVLVGMIGVSRDISARKRAEEALAQSEAQLRFLADNMADMLWTMDLNFRTTFVSPSVTRVLGFTQEERKRQSLAEMVTPDSARRTLAVLQQQLQLEASGTADPNRSLTMEVEYYHKDGSITWFENVMTAVRDSEGRLAGLLGVSRDMSERRHAAEALREGERKYRELFEQSVDAINLVSVDGRVIDANPAWFRLFGYAADDISSYNARDAYADPAGRAHFLEEIAESDRVEDEVQFKRKDGSVFDCHRTVIARRGGDGSVVGYQTVFHDITEQKKAERALRESEEKYRLLFDQSIAPISLIAPDGRMIEANDAWFHLFGYSREDMGAFRVWDIYPTRELRDQSVRRLVDSGRLLDDEARVKTKDGRFIDVLRSMIVQHNPDGGVLGYQTIWRDITAQKQAEQALKDSEEKYRQLFDQSVAPISLAAPDGHLIEANDAWFRLFGYTRDDMPRFTTYELYDDPGDRDRTIRQAREEGQLIDDAARHKRKDGSIIEVLRSVSVRRDQDGNIFGYQAVYRDVTDLKKAQDELLASREQLRELAIRMQEVLERERTTVAHDLHDRITQGLTALSLDLDALKRRLCPVAPDLVRKVEDSISMIEGLTATSRDIMTELRPGMLDDLGLCAAIDWQIGQFSQRTGIRYDVSLLRDDSAISPIQATALFRILQELLANVARHAEATKVSVGLECREDSVVLTVSDNGRGISDQQVSSAASLGLLGIHERVRALGGDFAVRRGRGKGTVASVRLPLDRGPAAATRPPAPSA